MRRVVVTGMGIVSSLGNNSQEVLASLREAKARGLRTVAMPFTLSGYQAPARAARRLGEDNDDVL